MQKIVMKGEKSEAVPAIGEERGTARPTGAFKSSKQWGIDWVINHEETALHPRRKKKKTSNGKKRGIYV